MCDLIWEFLVEGTVPLINFNEALDQVAGVGYPYEKDDSTVEEDEEAW